MKILTTTLLVCATAIGGSAYAADAHYERDRSGDWKVMYTPPPAKTSQQVHDELMQAKADGSYSFGQEDYPAPVAMHSTESSQQVAQELQQAQRMGMMASDQEDYPPTSE